MFASKNKIAEHFKSIFEFYGYAGKPMQWQIGFRCGIEAVMRKLYNQLYLETSGEIQGKRAYSCKATGDNFLLVCATNMEKQVYGEAMLVLMNVDTGEIVSVALDRFAKKFE